MVKQLSKKDYIWSIVLLIMFACIVAAFLWGVKVGQDSTEKRYAHLIAPTVAVPEELQTYDQRYLSSFYHTIYLPYREFLDKWFDGMEQIELQQKSTNPEAIVEELEQLAQETYEDIQEITIPETAVYIHDAHKHYLSSLNLFNRALSDRALKRSSAATMIRAIENNEFVQEAKHAALEGQKSYYLAMVKWEEDVNPDAFYPDKSVTSPIRISDWENMTVSGKSFVSATILAEGNIFKHLTPPDVVTNVDHLIRTGQANELKLGSIDSIVNVLINTNTIRAGDFKDQKNRYYANEAMPQIPLFYN